MSYLLCTWLNKELRLSQVVEPKTFTRDFSNGYLIGEILHKYHLQTDFNMFNNDDNKSSKANNFSRLKPTLQMIGMSLDETTAQELMERKQGVASLLIYELYVALKTEKKGIMGASFVDMIPSAHLRSKAQVLYSEKLYRGYDSGDIKPGQMSQLIQDEYQQLNFTFRDAEAAQQNKYLNVKRKVHLTTAVQEAKALKKKIEQQRTGKQAQVLQNEIKKFEENTKELTISFSSDFNLDCVSEAFNMRYIGSKQHFLSEYTEQIKQRVKEDAFAQKQRERRAAQFVLEQSKARKAEQDAQFEQSLVKRLIRQTKMEKRLATELLQGRAQEEELLKNSLIRQQQFQQRRERDFQEALKRNVALIHAERRACAAESQRKLHTCNKLAAERKKKKHLKHFGICKEIMGQIVDLAAKAGDYHLLTDRLIPEKQMMEWKELLFCGQPLYEQNPLKLCKEDLLTKSDFEEYTNMVGEWEWPENAQFTEKPPDKSNICDHVIRQIRNFMRPASAFPHNLKACVLGKTCSGKTTCLEKIAQAHALYVLSTDKLVEEVLNAYCSADMDANQHSSPAAKDDPDHTEKVTDTKDLSFQFTDWTLLGEAAHKVITEGNEISAELHVAIITEAIRRLPRNSGWILDGFPEDIAQAHLLEKALGGEVGGATGGHRHRTDPPKVSAPVLDLALILEVSDENVASRAAKQTDVNELAVQNRIAAFEETWPQVEEWFGQEQNILSRVNADVEKEELFKAVESIIKQVKKPTKGFAHQRRAAFVRHKWDTAYKLYVNKVKAALQELRLQRTAFDQHLIHLRDEFKLYLNRTDPKPDLISKWQKDHKQIPLRNRRDEAKVQQRLDDLLEELWHMSDKRMEENEQKMCQLRAEWLKQCRSVLLHLHSTLTQAEVERFQLTCDIIKLHCQSKCKNTTSDKVPEEIYSKIKSHEMTEHAKTSLHGSLICAAEEANRTISNLIEALLFNCEKREPKDKEERNTSTSRMSFPALNQDLNQEVTETAMIGTTVQNKTYDEYSAALHQEGDATKARVALIKAHGFERLNSLQSKDYEMLSVMEELMKEQFMAEMKSIDHVAEAVRHHMESDPKFQNELDLLSSYSFQMEKIKPVTAPPFSQQKNKQK